MKFNNLTPDKELAIELTNAYVRVLSSGVYINGPEVEAFESEWAAYAGSQYCVGVSSGQAALELLLRAYGIGYGDEVIVPSWTAVPTWKAVINVGAKPKGIDVNYDTMLLEPKSVMNYTGSQTKAIVPVHLYGYRADNNYGGWPVIEDACQAHGLKNLGNAAWSFYPTKNLGAYGDGGVIMTNNQDLADEIRRLRDSNRLDELQAAFLRVKLRGLDEEIDRRAGIAYTYDVKLPECLDMPLNDWTCHQYVIRTPQRDTLKAHLADKGIETLIHYPVPPHRLLGYDYDLPVADRLASEVLSLPLWGDVERVCEVINEFYRNH